MYVVFTETSTVQPGKYWEKLYNLLQQLSHSFQLTSHKFLPPLFCLSVTIKIGTTLNNRVSGKNGNNDQDYNNVLEMPTELTL